MSGGAKLVHGGGGIVPLRAESNPVTEAGSVHFDFRALAGGISEGAAQAAPSSQAVVRL